MKKNCYIAWDKEITDNSEIHIYCEKCFLEKRPNAFYWDKNFLHGNVNIKCAICQDIIYEKNEDVTLLYHEDDTWTI